MVFVMQNPEDFFLFLVMSFKQRQTRREPGVKEFFVFFLSNECMLFWQIHEHVRIFTNSKNEMWKREPEKDTLAFL